MSRLPIVAPSPADRPGRAVDGGQHEGQAPNNGGMGALRRWPTIALALSALVWCLQAAAARADPVQVPLDGEVTLESISIGCTGIGQEKSDPRWAKYPLRVEFADSTSAYLAGEVLTVYDPAGGPPLEIACDGPWILLDLPKGESFKVSAYAEGQPDVRKTGIVRAAAHGQARFTLIFPVSQ